MASRSSEMKKRFKEQRKKKLFEMHPAAKEKYIKNIQKRRERIVEIQEKFKTGKISDSKTGLRVELRKLRTTAKFKK